MGEGDPLIYSIIGFFGGLYLFYKGLAWFRLRRLIENLPTSKVRSIAMGLVEIYGEVKPFQAKLLKSPLLQKECVYYDMQIKEKRGSGKHSHWVTICSGKDMVPFILKDETGEVLVDPHEAKVDFRKDLDCSSGTIKIGQSQKLPQTALDYMKAKNIALSVFLGMGNPRTYTEIVISPKDMLYILGTAGKNPYMKEATALKSEDAIMIQASKNNEVYYIADKSEKDLVKGFKWKSLGGIFGGAALSVVCLAVILIYLRIF